jgi:hypothetical protein
MGSSLNSPPPLRYLWPPTILYADSGKVHIMAHSYFNQLFHKMNIPKEHWTYNEEKKDKRFPLFCFHTLNHPRKVKEGETITLSGNAGYSTAAYLHGEFHPDNKI